MMNSYPSVYQVGHAAIANLFDGEVQIEEKVDGSQFSFGIVDGEILCKSKNVRFSPDMANKMFNKAVETVLELTPLLKDGWQYRCEYLQKPKQNTLCYERTPKSYLILFDINTGLESYMSYEDKKAEAERIGLECVPLLYRGKVETYDQFLTGQVYGYIIEKYGEIIDSCWGFYGNYEGYMMEEIKSIIDYHYKKDQEEIVEIHEKEIE